MPYWYGILPFIKKEHNIALIGVYGYLPKVKTFISVFWIACKTYQNSLSLRSRQNSALEITAEISAVPQTETTLPKVQIELNK